MFEFKKLLQFTDKELKTHARTLVDVHRKQIAKGVDHEGKPFAKYSKMYAKSKSAKAFNKQGQISTQTNPVNLKLTGKLLQQFSFISSKIKGELLIKYGFKSDRIAKERGMNADKRMTSLTHGKKTKRVIASSNNLGPDVEDALGHIFASQIANNLARFFKRKTKVYRV